MRVIKNPDNTKNMFTPIHPNFKESILLGQCVEITKNAANARIPSNPGKYLSCLVSIQLH
jgi:hypothetical protein